MVVPVSVSRRKTSKKPLTSPPDQVGRGALEHDIAAVGRHHAAGGDVVGAGAAGVDRDPGERTGIDGHTESLPIDLCWRWRPLAGKNATGKFRRKTKLYEQELYE